MPSCLNMESAHLYFQDIFWRCQYHTNFLCFLVALPWFVPTVGPESQHLAPNKGLKGGCLATFSNLFPSPSSLGRVTEGMSSGLLVTVLNPDSGTLR